MLSKSQQQAYDRMVDEAVQLVKSHTFVRVADLAEHFNRRSKNFPALIMRAAVSRGLLTQAEWLAGFTGRHRKRFVNVCPSSGFRGKWQRIEKRQGV